MIYLNCFQVFLDWLLYLRKCSYKRKDFVDSLPNQVRQSDGRHCTCYISKGSYTLSFTQPKNFQSCTCLLFLWPISSPTVCFWQLFRIFCICLFLSIRCSYHFPAIFGSFQACFALVCLCHQHGSSCHSLTHHLLLVAFQDLSHWASLSGVGTMSLETTGTEKVSILWLQYLPCTT